MTGGKKHGTVLSLQSTCCYRLALSAETPTVTLSLCPWLWSAPKAGLGSRCNWSRRSAGREGSSWPFLDGQCHGPVVSDRMKASSTPAPAAGAPGASSLAAGGSWGLVLSAEWDRNLHLSRPPEPSTACDFRKMADFWMGWEQKVEFHHGLTTHRVACCREAVRGPGFPWQHPETLIPCVVL